MSLSVGFQGMYQTLHAGMLIVYLRPEIQMPTFNTELVTSIKMKEGKAFLSHGRLVVIEHSTDNMLSRILRVSPRYFSVLDIVPLK
jgi:hypothetical protein